MHIKGAVAKFNFDTAPDSNDWSDAAARQQREQTAMAIREWPPVCADPSRSGYCCAP